MNPTIHCQGLLQLLSTPIQQTLPRNSTEMTSQEKNCNVCVCKKNHSAQNCDVVTDYQKRINIVREGNLCYDCLAHHRVSQCTSKFQCRKCKRKHHTSLCSDSSTEATTHEKKSIPNKSTNKKSVSDITPTTGKFIMPALCSEAPQNLTCLLTVRLLLHP